MANQPIGGDAAPVTLPSAMLPMPAVARILSRHDRDKLAALVTVAIALFGSQGALLVVQRRSRAVSCVSPSPQGRPS